MDYGELEKDLFWNSTSAIPIPNFYNSFSQNFKYYLGTCTNGK